MYLQLLNIAYMSAPRFSCPDLHLYGGGDSYAINLDYAINQDIGAWCNIPSTDGYKFICESVI